MARAAGTANVYGLVLANDGNIDGTAFNGGMNGFGSVFQPDPNNAGHYNTNGVRYFYVSSTGRIISK